LRQLAKGTVAEGRKYNSNLDLGICGEPCSVQFCHHGVISVSCFPYRLPLARLAAAQAAISGDKFETQRTA